MIGRNCRSLLLAISTAAWIGSLAQGQTPELAPMPGAAVEAPGNAAVRVAPFTPGRPLLGSLPPTLVEEPDPLLLTPPVPPGLPSGFYFDVDATLQAAHLKNRLQGLVLFNGAVVGPIHVPTADYNWTVSPCLELGYRMPHGLGELLMSYRFLVTDGSTTVGEGPAAINLRSRLDLQVCDLDYATRENPLAPPWDMRWRVGVRLAAMFFDARSRQPATDPVLGFGLQEQRNSSYFAGAGPHAGLELARRLGDTGLALYSELSGAALYVHLHQETEQTLTLPDPTMLPAQGLGDSSTSQGVGIVEVRGGLRWTPQGLPDCCFFLGYQYEWWYQVGRDDRTLSRADFQTHGLFFRGLLSF